jgi:hypothetical protein
MTIHRQLLETGVIVRRVVIVPGVPAVVTDETEAVFPIAVVRPTTARPSGEASPRTYPRYRLRWAEGFRAPAGALLTAGDRISVSEVTYELLTQPRALHAGRSHVGWEVEAQDIAVLYPLTAVLHDQDASVLAAAMPCAVWGGVDRREAAGEYEDLDGETPIEFEAVLKTNTYLVIGTQKLRFLSAVTDHVGPRVVLSLRSPQ